VSRYQTSTFFFNQFRQIQFCALINRTSSHFFTFKGCYTLFNLSKQIQALVLTKASLNNLMTFTKLYITIDTSQKMFDTENHLTVTSYLLFFSDCNFCSFERISFAGKSAFFAAVFERADRIRSSIEFCVDGLAASS